MYLDALYLFFKSMIKTHFMFQTFCCSLPQRVCMHVLYHIQYVWQSEVRHRTGEVEGGSLTSGL